jgi:hypothetical protein
MIIICGKTIAEVERDLEMAKQAIASGMSYGVGGATIEDVEQAMAGLRSAVGEDNTAIDNSNCTSPCGCNCGCGCSCYEEDEGEDTCPECGGYMVDGYCEDCGFPGEYEEEEEEEDEPPIVTALADMLYSLGMDEATIRKLMQSALGL